MPTYGVNPATSTVPPWAVQQRIGTTAARYALNTMLMPRTDSGLSYTDYRSGVMASGDGGTTHLAMKVSPGSGMSVTVAQGNCVINTPNQGAYMCCLDSQKTITIPASSATTRRYDLVVARVYDDNNSALSGSANVRQFTVELVQGDASTGTPTVPAAPVGAIPLAYVHVDRSVSVINAADIADLRGPGIVARGGMRALYGADTKPGAAAYDQPGAYPGDQRWVHTSGFQHQVYYGGGSDPTRSGWRGVHNALVYNVRPPSNLMGLMCRGTGTSWELCRLTVPYPGTPFMIYPTGLVYADLSAYTSADAYVSLDGKDGPWVTLARRDSGSKVEGPAGDTRQGWECPPVMWGPFTAAQTVVLAVRVNVTTYTNNQGGIGFLYTHPEASLLSVVVYPSTVQPPEA